jgi:branched-chain amino acid transport system permease protein
MEAIVKSPYKCVLLTVFLIGALFIPFIIKDTYMLKVVNNVMLYSIVALSINLIIGFAGLLDFGRAAFAGLGTYFLAIILTRFHGIPFWVAFLGAGLFAAVVGWFMGVLCQKTTFDYLTLITCGFSEICRLVFLNWQSVTGGGIGIINVPSPNFFGFVLDTHRSFFYFAYFLLALCYILINRLIESHYGRAFEAIRDDVIAAAYSAINVPRYKALCFSLGSFFTGIAGAAMVSYTNYASPNNFTLDESLIMMQMAILGGLGNLPGCVLGAAILIIAPELSRTVYDYRLLIMGGLMVVLMLFAPNGLLGKDGVGDRMIGVWHFFHTDQGTEENTEIDHE